ncbi:hypothetical protein E2C01_077026 [Portunus trituberculatus]|uniref:Uncharacterized protein n=1 Tax=Portunus trituberculatus TaxID=210409 RepID=A0A5B7IJ61_PORTR|nr:hypothetical protein [Portunus trituberculatus]
MYNKNEGKKNEEEEEQEEKEDESEDEKMANEEENKEDKVIYKPFEKTWTGDDVEGEQGERKVGEGGRGKE